MVGAGEKSRFGEEVARACGVQDHEMAVDGSTHQPQLAALHLVDRGRLIALHEQRLARAEVVDYACRFQRRRKGSRGGIGPGWRVGFSRLVIAGGSPS
jgi:hypothetical protein